MFSSGWFLSRSVAGHLQSRKCLSQEPHLNEYWYVESLNSRTVLMFGGVGGNLKSLKSLHVFYLIQPLLEWLDHSLSYHETRFQISSCRFVGKETSWCFQPGEEIPVSGTFWKCVKIKPRIVLSLVSELGATQLVGSWLCQNEVTLILAECLSLQYLFITPDNGMN